MNHDLLKYKDAWLNLEEDDLRCVVNPFFNRTDEEMNNSHLHVLKLLRNPRYISYSAKLFLDIDLLPVQVCILRELWTSPFPMFLGSRGFGKSFLAGVYIMLKLLLYPDTKAVVCGSAFRQGKIIFDYMETLWKNSGMIKSICSGNSGPRRSTDKCTMTINDSVATICPIGDGSKIRGLRANIIWGDEFNSIPPEIYEIVIAGFAAVSQNPIENVKQSARRQAMLEEGTWTEEHEEIFLDRPKNQSILSGTCGYTFQHFYTYWKRYHDIISSKGDPKKLKNVWGESYDELSKKLNWKDFSIIRIPYELVPDGFMDDKQILRAKATMHAGVFNAEYSACFVSDSYGFFKRSLIESCVANSRNMEQQYWPKFCPLPFDAKTRGHEKFEYVFGIDPASEQDNFAIVVLEVHPEHQRLVYTWTTNKTDFRERQQAGTTDIGDYYSFCIRKIRELMRLFNCVRIGLDSQGGGHALLEGLRDQDKMAADELPIWEVIEDGVEKDTDRMAGLHIVELINFSKADWTSMANSGLRKDMEDKVLLFPRFDPVTLSLAVTIDNINLEKLKSIAGEGKSLKLYDTFEDCVLEIEELKNELSTIIMTQTGIVGRDRWDTPEVKLANGKKGRLRKDRYSALVIANMLARQIHRALPDPEYNVVGRASKGTPKKDTHIGSLYYGNEWATKNLTKDVCFAVNRRK